MATTERQQPRRRAPPSWDRLLTASARNEPDIIRSLVSPAARFSPPSYPSPSPSSSSGVGTAAGGAPLNSDGPDSDSADADGLDLPVSPDHSNAVGQSALHVSSLWGHAECVHALLDAGANPDCTNRITGATPLHCAVQSGKLPLEGRIECARILIEEGGADAGKEDMYGMTPVEYLDEDYADWNGCEEADVTRFREVLMSGVGGGGSGDGGGLLIDAIRRCDEEAATECIASARSEEGEGKKALLDAPDAATGFPPLLLAVDRVLRLCDEDDDEGGIDGENDGRDGSTDQRQDQCSNLLSIAEALLIAGADPNATPKKRRRRRPRSVNDDEAENEEEEDGDDLLNNNEDDGSNAPLHRTCASLSSAYRSSPPSSRDDEDEEGDGCGRTVSTLESLASLLAEHGALPREPTVRLMHDSARRDDLRTVRFLIENVGVDVNSRGRQGMTALHFASRSGRAEVVRWLLAYRPLEEDGKSNGGGVVDVAARDDRGKTALDAARVNDKAEVVALLQEAEAEAEATKEQ